MKKYFIVLISVFTLLILTGCDTGGVDNSEFVSVKSETLNEDINSFYIEWNSGIVSITKSSSDTITINEKAKEDFLESNMFEYEVNNGQLKVLDPHYSRPVIMLEHDIEISIPDKDYQEININGTSIQIDMQDFTAQKLTLNNDTTEQNISGNYREVHSQFTSSALNYEFNTLPETLVLDGYVSSGDIRLPADSQFSLIQNLDDSKLNNDFEVKSVENRTGSISVTLRQSELNLVKE